MLLSFTLVIFAGLLSLLLVSVTITEQNVSRLINQDIIELKKSVDLYIGQYYMSKNVTLDQKSFQAEADGLMKELSVAVSSPISVFDAGGKGLSRFNAEEKPTSSDFAESVCKGKSLIRLSVPVRLPSSVSRVLSVERQTHRHCPSCKKLHGAPRVHQPLSYGHSLVCGRHFCAYFLDGLAAVQPNCRTDR